MFIVKAKALKMTPEYSDCMIYHLNKGTLRVNIELLIIFEDSRPNWVNPGH